MIRRLGGAARGAMDSDMEEGFRVGDKVEARFKGGTRWHPGRITEKNRDGTFDVRFEDGDEERRVESRNIRELAKRSSRSPDADRDKRYEKGDRVEARLGGGSRWKAAKVVATHRDGTYDLEFDNGDDERRVEAKYIRADESR